MRIKDVEDLVGITKKNIRFYEKEGLLNPERELENSYRDYTEEDIRRLRIIKLLRKMDMPISSISDVLEGRIPLHESLHLHQLLLEERRNAVINAQRVCRMIAEEGAELTTLDTERYLEEIEHTEENSTALVNIKHKDTATRYRETILVSAVIAAILTALAVVLLVMNRKSLLPGFALYAGAAVILLLFVGVVAALISRLKEIQGGEEDDLGNY